MCRGIGNKIQHSCHIIFKTRICFTQMCKWLINIFKKFLLQRASVVSRTQLNEILLKMALILFWMDWRPTLSRDVSMNFAFWGSLSVDCRCQSIKDFIKLLLAATSYMIHLYSETILPRIVFFALRN